MRRVKSGVVVLLAAVGAACAVFDPPVDPFGRPESRDAPRLQVVNNNFSDATLWVVYAGDRVRLGVIPGKAERFYTLRSSRVTEVVHMEIDLVGGDRCRTQPLSVDAGDVLELHIKVEVSQMPECAR